MAGSEEDHLNELELSKGHTSSSSSVQTAIILQFQATYDWLWAQFS